VAIDAARAPAGECGVENQVGRVGVFNSVMSTPSLTTKFVSVGRFCESE
jgi:hypothetical protein